MDLNPCRPVSDPEWVNLRELYRQLGMLFVPMRERRGLLFPERQRSTS
jgi:hypothetical protein